MHSLSELEEGSVLVLMSGDLEKALGSLSRGQLQPLGPHIRVEIGLGYNMSLTISEGESPTSITERLCRWNDICRLRRVTNEQVFPLFRLFLLFLLFLLLTPPA